MSRQLNDHPVVTHLRRRSAVRADGRLADRAGADQSAGERGQVLAGRARRSSYPRPTRRRRLVVEVADRGPGLPQADLERVFEKFYRAANSARAAPAPAWGWRFAAASIELHGGQIVAENRPGRRRDLSLHAPLGQHTAGPAGLRVFGQLVTAKCRFVDSESRSTAPLTERLPAVVSNRARSSLPDLAASLRRHSPMPSSDRPPPDKRAPSGSKSPQDLRAA